MGSRERKRAERQKRKRRAAHHTTAPVGDQVSADAVPADGSPQPSERFQERMGRRSEERNAATRAGLKPLAEGERPGAVTVGAAVSAVIATIFTVSAIVAIFSTAEIDGNEPSPAPLAIFAVPLWMMTWGMWKARYWAVLGFQMLLVLVMLSGAVAMVGAASILQVMGAVIFLLGSGALFYFMIRALARIQMPDRPGAP
jgi:hypothetical protein